jgi:hypothetical protein
VSLLALLLHYLLEVLFIRARLATSLEVANPWGRNERQSLNHSKTKALKKAIYRSFLTGKKNKQNARKPRGDAINCLDKLRCMLFQGAELAAEFVLSGLEQWGFALQKRADRGRVGKAVSSCASS